MEAAPVPVREVSGPDRVDVVSALWARCSSEPLSQADLRRTVGEDDGVVLATDDGAGVVATVSRPSAAGPRGHVRLIAVRPDRRRRGLGLALLRAAEAWLAEHGAAEARLGGEIPRYLWPGVDAADLGAVSLALAAGYRSTGTALNLSMPTSYRHDPPAGTAVRLVGPDRPEAEQTALLRLVDEHWPAWRTEVSLAAAAGTVAVAFPVAPERPPMAVGFCAHSTLRDGWIGPMGTSPDGEGRGIASATLAAVCADLAGRGHDRAEVAWVGPVGWFADRGARTSRVLLRFARALDAAAPVTPRA